jgi:beta-glucosidase
MMQFYLFDVSRQHLSLRYELGFLLSRTFCFHQFPHGDIIKVSVDVKNTGKVAGKESVLLFSSDLIASMVPDGRRLRAFDKVELQPGETKTMTFELKADDLAFVGWDGKWRLEEGDFKLMIADQSADIHCTDTYQWSTANR